MYRVREFLDVDCVFVPEPQRAMEEVDSVEESRTGTDVDEIDDEIELVTSPSLIIIHKRLNIPQQVQVSGKRSKNVSRNVFMETEAEILTPGSTCN